MCLLVYLSLESFWNLSAVTGEGSVCIPYSYLEHIYIASTIEVLIAVLGHGSVSLCEMEKLR